MFLSMVQRTKSWRDITHTKKTIHHVAVACKYLSPVQKVLMERTDIHNRVQPSGWTSHIHSTNDPKLFINLLVVAHQWPWTSSVMMVCCTGGLRTSMWSKCISSSPWWSGHRLFSCSAPCWPSNGIPEKKHGQNLFIIVYVLLMNYIVSGRTTCDAEDDLHILLDTLFHH